MKSLFNIGDQQIYKHTVLATDMAAFESGEVHAVYATFAIARDAEWAGRLFVLAMKENEEEGIGTFVNIAHRNPAFLDEVVIFTTSLRELNGNNVICDFEAKVGERMIANGSTGQKIIAKDKLEKHFEQIRSGN